MAEVDYYKILGVPKGASTSQIKVRYQTLAKKFHPDHSGDDTLMSLINEAYQVLSDPQKRYKYDHTNYQPKASTSSQSYTRPTQNNYNQANRTYTSTSQPKVKARPKRKSNPVGSIIVLVITGIVWLVAAHHPSSTASGSDTNSSSSSTTPAQDVINSMNQNYQAPTYSSSFTTADQTTIANSCMDETGISSYAYSTQVRYCGCALSEIEENYTPTEIDEDNADGLSATIDTQSQNTINEYCNNLL